jgi:MoaA/NifB/PqqE/SkfB family radical SAM enzyme
MPNLIAKSDNRSELSTHSFEKGKNSLPKIIFGWHKYFIERIIWSQLLIMAMGKLHNPQRAFRAILNLEKMRRRYMGDHSIKRIIKLNGKYSWHPNTPAWPSAAFNFFHENELNRIDKFREIRGELNLLILSITKKCPLECEHCFEWDIMHQPEVLGLDDLKSIVKKYQEKGLGTLEISGGEPLSRFEDLLELIQYGCNSTEVWVLTSGFGLTLNKADRLKKAGLTGITISLDHYEEDKHNSFRGNNKSFYWVQESIENATKVGLTTCLSICVVRSFVSKENLLKYTDLAKSLGVCFVQILEPKATGKYADKDVLLTENQISVLEEFHFMINSEEQYKSYPLIVYHGYHQRRMGCLGGGSRYIYVDSNGDIHPCPFCRKPIGNALYGSNGEDRKTATCKSFEFSDA